MASNRGKRFPIDLDWSLLPGRVHDFADDERAQRWLIAVDVMPRGVGNDNQSRETVGPLGLHLNPLRVDLGEGQGPMPFVRLGA